MRLAVASNAASTFSLTIRRASCVAATPPLINLTVRMAITLLDSSASNIKGMDIFEYLQYAPTIRLRNGSAT